MNKETLNNKETFKTFFFIIEWHSLCIQSHLLCKNACHFVVCDENEMPGNDDY